MYLKKYSPIEIGHADTFSHWYFLGAISTYSAGNSKIIKWEI